MEPSATIITADSRSMPELEENSIDLVVTSPPYWHLKDYTTSSQIGYGQTLHEYLRDLFRVWTECQRVLRPGGRMCVNIGDQFARSVVYGRYKVIPLHSEVIAQAEQLGLDFMGSIIWQKKTTMNTTGGATVMGSFPYPPNGIVEIDYEYIMIFKKPGKNKHVSSDIKEHSKLTKEEWKTYFKGHWTFSGTRQVEHEAMFPEELPYRLIRMFSFAEDKVLDPFLGSGTTAKVALNAQRNAVGYEINEDFHKLIKDKLGVGEDSLFCNSENVSFRQREMPVTLHEVDYKPNIQDANPRLDEKKLRTGKQQLYKVSGISPDLQLHLDTGLKVSLLGVNIRKRNEAEDYLRNYVLGKQITLDFDSDAVNGESTVNAYVHLKNRIFVNAYMIKAGLADADQRGEHRLQNKFNKLETEREKHG